MGEMGRFVQRPKWVGNRFVYVTSQDLRELGFTKKTTVRLEVTFMRTWRDAVIVNVRMCGVRVGHIDALWDVRASSPADAAFTVPASKCLQSDPEQLRVTFSHVPPSKIQASNISS